MKNITVSVPDEVYRQARIRAAERGRSVSALVAEYLGSLGERETELARLREQRHRIIESIDSFSAADRIGRDELHERGVR